MKKLASIFVIVMLACILHNSIQAVTKQDVINYVNNQEVCGDSSLFNSYKATFTRMLKQKSINQEDLSRIYSCLKNSIGILKSKGVCQISDLNKLTDAEKNSVYSNLTTGAGIINSARGLSLDEMENENSESIADSKTTTTNPYNSANTNISINTEENVMEIYEDGVLMNKISLDTAKMTYTGSTGNYVLIIVTFCVVLLLSLVTYFILEGNKKRVVWIAKNILLSVSIMSFAIIVSLIVFRSKIDMLVNTVNTITFSQSTKTIDVSLDENNKITKYPSYGKNYGTLLIPELKESQKIYFGDDKKILQVGIGQSTSYSMPTEGNVIVYSGHNSKDKLHFLADVKQGMSIQIDTSYAKCVYNVDKIEVLKDTDINKFKKIDNKETLIIYTCYPIDNAIYTDSRLAVFATIKEIEWK